MPQSWMSYLGEQPPPWLFLSWVWWPGHIRAQNTPKWKMMAQHSTPALLPCSDIAISISYNPPCVNIVYVDLVMPSVVPIEGAPVLLVPLCEEGCRCQGYPSCTLPAMGSGSKAWMLLLLLYGWAPELRVWAGPCGAHWEGRVAPEEWCVSVWFKHHQLLSQQGVTMCWIMGPMSAMAGERDLQEYL